MTGPYPRYRDSDVEWLGEVPDHWEIRRLSHAVVRSDEKVESEDADGMLYVGLEHVESWTGQMLPLDDQLTPESIVNSFAGGDVLFGKLRPYLAKALCADFGGLCSAEFLVLKPHEYVGRYLLHLLLTDGFVSLVDSSTYGAKMPRARWDFVGDALLPLPPLDEQRAIAAFLDRETERIDALVAKKRLLIERLEEYRTALVTRTVTRGLPPEAARAAGLDPSPRLKPSGVEWLGDVPEHWEVLRLRDCSQIQTGPFGSQLHADEYVVGGVPVINPSNLVGGRLFPSDEDTIPLNRANELRRHAFAAGDLAFGRRGEMARAAMILGKDLPALCGTGCLRISPERQRVEPSFLLFSLGLRELRSWLELVAVGSTLANLNEQIVGRVPVTMPPLREQRVIVEHLNESLEGVQRLAKMVKTAIEQLEEYRTALITAAVTGKIDVRESMRESAASAFTGRLSASPPSSRPTG